MMSEWKADRAASELAVVAWSWWAGAQHEADGIAMEVQAAQRGAVPCTHACVCLALTMEWSDCHMGRVWERASGSMCGNCVRQMHTLRVCARGS